MTVKFALAAVAALTLSACADPAAMSNGGRMVAKQVVNSVVSSKLPGVDASAMTDCIIDNASDAEVITLAAGAVTGTTEATTKAVLDIASRPATQSCMMQGAQTALLNGNLASLGALAAGFGL